MNKPPLATNMHLCCRDANHKHLYLLANAGAKRGVAEVEERSPHLRFCEWESWRNLEEASVTDGGGGGGISSSLAPAHLCSPPPPYSSLFQASESIGERLRRVHGGH
ncbi:hypothetical protein FQA47_015072 [Oryzias melastigma]|uniref:Uncharacterized protein n=1 Tax=Oryzias melastigma TaxID=30732 RepID=A0A834BVF7_ORYME|nr:hypothetical protein FQA47_015072 [Oryzias melastigma]